jgi:hypothetical protein
MEVGHDRDWPDTETARSGGGTNDPKQNREKPVHPVWWALPHADSTEQVSPRSTSPNIASFRIVEG